MCVLTYIPIEDGFILTSNRDEATKRASAIPPRKYKIGNESVFYPKDPVGSGSWIATHTRFTICLLNGAEKKHIPNPPYKMSRGLVVIEFFKFLDVEQFLTQFDFDNIEPFTLVIIDNQNHEHIHQLRWNGVAIDYQPLSKNKAKIWSSSTLYTDDVIAFREKCFADFLEETISEETIVGFHEVGGGEDPENKLLMNRNNLLKTLSITQIMQDEANFTIQYHDLPKKKSFKYRVFKEVEIL